MLTWYDQRNDIAIATNPVYFTKYIEDSLCRHTVDVRVTQADPGDYPMFSPSQQVTRYLHVLETNPDGTPKIGLGGFWDVTQVEFNPPNYPLFQLGTVPFFGTMWKLPPCHSCLVQMEHGRTIPIQQKHRFSIQPGPTTVM